MAATDPHRGDPPPPLQPPEIFEVPKNPVRDDSCLAPDEDLDRQPDGVPHDVVGFTALFSVFLAMLIAFMFLSGHTFGWIAGTVLAIFAIPALVTGLRGKADRDRDRLHPSR